MNIEIIPHFYIKRQREKNNIIIFIIYFKKYCFIKKCLFHNQIAQNIPYLSKVMGGIERWSVQFFLISNILFSLRFLNHFIILFNSNINDNVYYILFSCLKK